MPYAYDMDHESEPSHGVARMVSVSRPIFASLGLEGSGLVSKAEDLCHKPIGMKAWGDSRPNLHIYIEC